MLLVHLCHTTNLISSSYRLSCCPPCWCLAAPILRSISHSTSSTAPSLAQLCALLVMADYTAATIAALQPLIKKPTLKPALLQKPPFRFLHDIITNLQSSSAAFPPAQLFPADQLSSENVKEKEQKVAFLARVVEAVEAVNGGKVDVSTAKIIAGLEPEKTNVLLQQLAAAAQKGLSEEEIVSKVNGTGTVRRDSKGAEAKPAPKAAAPAKPAAAAAAASPQPAASPEQSPQPTTRPKAGSTSSSSTSAAASTAPTARRSSRAAIALPPAPDTPEDFTQTTQRLLGALITRPTLKPNLLQKPPFRFLHDIVTSLVQSAANYPADYFSSEESDSAQLDSSDKKMAWLKKLIDVVEATTGEDLSGVQTKKIVAGLEADKTNLLLQALARAAASGVTAKDAVEKKAPAAAGKPKEAESKPAEPAAAKPASKATPVKATAAAAAAGPTSPQVPKLALKSVDEPPPAIAAPTLPGVDPETVGRLERPMTARQGPPKPKAAAVVEEKAEAREEKEADTKADTKATTAANSKAAAAAADKRKGLIVEGEQVEDDDEIAEEAPTDTQQTEQSIKQFEEEKLDASEQGGLMRKILQSTTDATAADASNGGAPTLSTLTPASSADDRTSALRQQLQRLCQSITPLGRVMECVVDDMDEMAREMSRWRKQREEYEGSVEDERRASVRVLEPLQAQLEDCERRLVEWEKKVMVQKSVLWRNENNIKKLMQQKVAGDS